MKFQTPRQYSFEIPDDWLEFTEFHKFSRASDYYPYSPHPIYPVEIVELKDVEPPERSAGTVLFKKYKMVPVLFAFQSPECALPPMVVTANEVPQPYKYRVLNGFHRYFASAACGYQFLPVVVSEVYID